ncbi:VOC family protein, partial [Pseudomonas veronii]
YLVTPHGYTILFYRVPDAKRVKNRAHMDLAVEDGTRDEEVERALRAGATMVDDRRADLGWAVLADPEGNEFCILDT